MIGFLQIITMPIQFLDRVTFIDTDLIRPNPNDLAQLSMQAPQRLIRIPLQSQPSKPNLYNVRYRRKPICGGVLPKRMIPLMYNTSSKYQCQRDNNITHKSSSQ